MLPRTFTFIFTREIDPTFDMVEIKQLSYRQRWGLAATLHSVIFSHLRWWFGLRIYGIYSRPLEMSADPEPAMPGFSFRRFQGGDVEALIEYAKRPGLDMREAFVREALEKGDVCHAIFFEGDIVAYNWSAFTPTQDVDGVFVGFGDNYRYGYKAFTLPEYRGLHLLQAFRLVRDRYCMVTHGRTHTIAYVAVDNRSSIHYMTSMGDRRIGFAGYLKRGPIFWPFRTPGARRHGFRFFLPPEFSAGRE